MRMGEVNHMPTYHPFLERLQRGPILCDGGMGTELYARGISYERCLPGGSGNDQGSI